MSQALDVKALVGATLGPLDLKTESGLSVVVGESRDGTDELVEMLSGMRRPRRGSVRVGGRDPWRDPDLRRRIGSLLAVEPALEAPTVAAGLERISSLRGITAAFGELAGRYGLDTWADRRPDDLTPGERRSLALAVALSVPDPVLLVLADPLAGAPALAHDRVVDDLRRRAERCAVVVTCASPADAMLLGGATHLLRQGRFVRRPSEPLATELVPGAPLEFRVRSDSGRALAAALSSSPAVSSVDLEAGRGVSNVTVSGPDPSAVALAIQRAALDAEVGSLTMTTRAPTLDAVSAATAGLAQAAYDHAYRVSEAYHRARDAGSPHAASPHAEEPAPGPEVKS